jgi:serine/threonine protein phosphatase PrpC
MGCGGSAEKIGIDAQRRRLSIGSGSADKSSNDEGDAEENRGLLTSLGTDNVLELLNANNDITGDRKFSIGSDADAGKTSFANKTMQQIGDKIDPAAHGMGFTCRKGLKPESPNQDSWSVLKVDGNFAIYAVYDGHGQKGHDVSNFVKEHLPKLIVRDARFKTEDTPQMLKDSFKKMQNLITTADRTKKLNAQLSGTTCTLVIHDLAKKTLTIAHVADSTCVLGKMDKDSKRPKGKVMTRDHKPDLPDEKSRIEKNGGRVVFDGYANHRIYVKNGRYPGLNMSRCLGDLVGHAEAGISCEPEVTVYNIEDDDQVLLLCSDGVWEFINADQAVDIVCQIPPSKSMLAADKLAKASWDRWITEEGGAVVDDITVVLVYLQAAAPTNKIG